MTASDDHVLRNRAAWDQWAGGYAAAGLRSWTAAEPSWGIWGIAEAQAGVLPPDLSGLDSIKLGCGTGYVSAWLARRGARPAALDNSPAQLAAARELQEPSEVGNYKIADTACTGSNGPTTTPWNSTSATAT